MYALKSKQMDWQGLLQFTQTSRGLTESYHTCLHTYLIQSHISNDTLPRPGGQLHAMVLSMHTITEEQLQSDDGWRMLHVDFWALVYPIGIGEVSHIHPISPMPLGKL